MKWETREMFFVEKTDDVKDIPIPSIIFQESNGLVGCLKNNYFNETVGDYILQCKPTRVWVIENKSDAEKFINDLKAF